MEPTLVYGHPLASSTGLLAALEWLGQPYRAARADLTAEARARERRISFAPGSREADRMHQLMAFLNTGFTGAFGALWAALEAEGADPAEREAWRRLGRRQAGARHGKP